MLPIYGTHASSIVLRFSRQTGEPQVDISSTPPSNKLSIGTAINLTCTAWQTDELAKDPRNKPYKIDWFDPHDKRIKSQCPAPGWPPAKIMKCTIKVSALTDGKPPTYTCRARNYYHYCSTKRFHIDHQQGK